MIGPLVRRLSVRGCTPSHLTVEVGPNATKTFHHHFLRDACPVLGLLIDPHSLQKTFTTAGIRADIQPRTPPVVRNGLLEVSWNDGTELVYPPEFFHRLFAPVRARGFQHLQQRLWDNDRYRAVAPQLVLQVDYAEYMELDRCLYKVLAGLYEYGLVFVNNIPDPANHQTPQGQWLVETIAERVGYVRETFYGRLFDVVVVPEAKNIAYTLVELPLHMDLCYYELVPGIQILHALQNRTAGGDNVFADLFAAAAHVKHTDPEAYRALLSVKVNYHYNHEHQHYFYARPVVVEGPDGEIDHVNYSPPFQAPFEHPAAAFAGSTPDAETTREYDAFCRGLRMFGDFVNDPRNQFVMRTPEGTAVLFNNRRVLHARQAFDTSATNERWLKGCYLDKDTFELRLRVLSRVYS